MSRIFVGGLPSDITVKDLEQRFSPFGNVLECEIVPSKEYRKLGSNVPEIYNRNFAYVSIDPKDDNSLKKAVHVYHGSKWRGAVLRCQLAKPTMMEVLKKESIEEESQNQEQNKDDRISTIANGTVLKIRNPDRQATFSQVTIGGPPPTLIKISEYQVKTSRAAIQHSTSTKTTDSGAFEARISFNAKDIRGKDGNNIAPNEEKIDGHLSHHTRHVDHGDGVNPIKMASNTKQQQELHIEAQHQHPIVINARNKISSGENQHEQIVRDKKQAANVAHTLLAKMDVHMVDAHKNNNNNNNISIKNATSLAAVDFFTEADEASLKARSAIDLSRFGGDSDDDSGTDGIKKVGIKRKLRHTIPQVDGADDSMSDSDDASSSKKQSDSDPDTSSSNDEEEENSIEKVVVVEEEEEDGDEDITKNAASIPREDAENIDQQPSEYYYRNTIANTEWMHDILENGRNFYRTEPLAHVEASWRAGRETAVRSYKERRKQSLRQDGGGVTKLRSKK